MDIVFIKHDSSMNGEIHLYRDEFGAYFIEILTANTELRKKFDCYGEAHHAYFDLCEKYGIETRENRFPNLKE